jgi:heme-degrading monooxygenase HmoA
MIANTPKPPYYAVIFTSIRTGVAAGYAAMALLMEDEAARVPGYLGIESARDGLGITVSYWASPEAIKTWKEQVQHAAAQRLGREKWYEAYFVRVCKMERDYGFGA